MRRYQIFLAYYTLISSILLFIWSIFFAQKPQGFLFALLVIPTSLYFWLIIGGAFKPENQNQEVNAKLPLIILLILFVGSFSIFVYSTVSTRSLRSQFASLITVSQELSLLKSEIGKLNQNNELSEKIAKDLKEIKNELSNLRSGQKETNESTVMGEATSQYGLLTIKDQKYPTVNVYQEASSSSKVIGKAEFGKTYVFIEKEQNWYLILLTDGDKNQVNEKQGFISNQFVKEVD